MGRPEPKTGGMMSVMLTCKDTAAALRYYRDTLGFTVKECWPNEDEPMWASLALNGQTLMIGAAFDGEHCGQISESERSFHEESARDFQQTPGGAGAFIYIEVEDVDAYHEQIEASGAKTVTAPKDEFYGIRDFATRDLDGYRLIFFKSIRMQNCQSCDMPLAKAEPGEIYCDYCTDDDGHLRPFEEVLEGTISGYFMGMQKMERAEAETAAKAHLATMPAWQAMATS